MALLSVIAPVILCRTARITLILSIWYLTNNSLLPPAVLWDIFACCLTAGSRLAWHSSSSPETPSVCLLMFAPSLCQGSCTAFFDSGNIWAIPHLCSVMPSFHLTSQLFVLNCLGVGCCFSPPPNLPCYTASSYSCTPVEMAFLHFKSLNSFTEVFCRNSTLTHSHSDS